MADHLTIPQLIMKKRNKEELSKQDIQDFIDAVVQDKAEGVQIGAMLMAMLLNDLTVTETTHLTNVMMNSGDTLKWPEEWNGSLVDKHSTGGVGDKISLVLAPALAACSLKASLTSEIKILPVPMISGRGLGHTGGTLDKVESIPGFQVAIKTDQMVDILRSVGCCIVGQTSNLCPADGVLYKSRDVTGTVDHIGLIAASIVSKKAAENVNALVLDVKAGKGAFCETVEKAHILADRMVQAGKGMNIKTSAVITDMNSPIGRMIGNALEVIEAIECLHGDGPQDINELVEQLGGQLLLSIGQVETIENGKEKIKRTLTDGTALKKFCAMCEAQGVAENFAEKLCTKGDISHLLPKAQHKTPIKSRLSGTISTIDAMECARIAQSLGAGRTKSDDKLKNGVGLELLVKVGSEIKEGKLAINRNFIFLKINPFNIRRPK
ncbi:hypothetical protein LOTGIDRAFT_218516 [Lottia gigantea]|uniref:Thymidine phosphorylase n=1 Tax=Lottia gigantea TaxID=225164 RepID=V3ZEZ2_LOTGI|nr:hypothetical protein LOTGIDRAFT_218516 [Lottia gigantea]ESO89723.1 hypothetical protein LOTGIDRAFT_218516 [Lottia gigantea]